jgi:glycosyltransferase involved in cell wall biosynthesis
MQAIDVVMLTKNSEHLLERCVDSIYENVPVKNLIVVDGFSTDSTLKIFDEENRRRGNVKILKVNGSRARAREKGIAQVTSDWFLFADSDVILSKDWYEKALGSVKSDVGAVWGVNIDVIPNLQDRRFLQIQQLIAGQCFTLRGGTHDTLIRRDIVKDIKIPERLHTYEDAFIMNWIKDKGYRTVVGEGIYCLHYKPPANWSPRRAISGAVEEMRCGLVYSHNFFYMAYYPIFMFYWALQIAFQGVRGLLPSPGAVLTPATDDQTLDAAKLELHQNPR